MAMKRIQFYFDFLSPYSYLAFTQINQVAARTGATVDFIPISVLALMKRVGNQPTTVMCDAKLAYAFQDLARWATDYGVPLNPNPNLSSIDVMPLLLGAQAAKHRGQMEPYMAAVFRGYWVDASAFEDQQVLLSMLVEAGIPEAATLLAESQGLPSELEQNLTEAVEAGVFGVPSFVADGQLFFGNDRLHFLEREIGR